MQRRGGPPAGEEDDAAVPPAVVTVVSRALDCDVPDGAGGADDEVEELIVLG